LFIGNAKEKEVFTRFYDKLACILPISNISPQLVTAQIITTGDNEEISAVVRSNEKASYVLRIIDKSLEAGITKSFYSLLEIMENYGSESDVTLLANEIRTALDELSGSLNDLYVLFSYTLYIAGNFCKVNEYFGKIFLEFIETKLHPACIICTGLMSINTANQECLIRKYF